MLGICGGQMLAGSGSRIDPSDLIELQALQGLALPPLGGGWTADLFDLDVSHSDGFQLQFRAEI
ncbi:hypothetical protein [Bradyrhizobium centrolobii]|uniref:hypothetical protein n=1 Tax=Bradyrhizobium centrolobii TaxID=1505087 RepID=UPI0010A96A87|nr:hypothetical protein [Bradyrhizobium centrolobii]